jgi:hypothetical protein
VGGAATRQPRGGVVWAITWVIVLRSDTPKQEVKVDRSRKCSVFCPTTWNDRSTEHLAPMKEDLPWNRCC